MQRGAATVHLHENASASVSVELEIVVSRGWLEELELDGFDQPARLDAQTPPALTAKADAAAKFTPQIGEGRGGALRFKFSGRGNSPRRGRYVVRFHYQTDMKDRLHLLEDGRMHLSWEFPGFRTSLDDVEITIVVPSRSADSFPATTSSDPSRTSSAHSTQTIRGKQTSTFVFRRGHLPRTVPWRVGVAVPRTTFPSVSSVDLGRRDPTGVPQNAAVAAPGFRATDWVPLGLWFWFLLHNRLYRRFARLRAAVPKALVPMPASLRVVLSLVVALGTVSVWGTWPTAGYALLVFLAALFTERTPEHSAASAAEEGWRVATLDELRKAQIAQRAEAVGIVPYLDPSTPVGFLLLCTAVAAFCFTSLPSGVAVDDAVALAALACLPLLSTTRFHLPRTVSARLLAAAQASDAVRQDDSACRLEVRGVPARDARLLVWGTSGEYAYRSVETSGFGGTIKAMKPVH